MAELLRATDVTREFNGVVAVKHASFVVQRGDEIALVGPSGSGKSTVMHLIARLDVPTGGTIAWADFEPSVHLRPRHVGTAFQGPTLLPPLTVEENIALPLLLLDETEATSMQRARELISTFHLDEVAQKLPEEISGGQSQRAAVARAIITKPDLVLADEPTGQQDRAGAARVVQTILECVRSYNGALIVATHDPEIAAVCARRWVISGGVLKEEAPSSL